MLDEIVRILGNRSRPEASWVSQVTGCRMEEAEDAIEEMVGHVAVIRALWKNIERTGREYYAQFPAPIDLYALVRLTHPSCLVESGVSSGFSSAFLLMGTRANRKGVLHSIDFPILRREGRGNESWAIPRGFSSGWAVPHELKGNWDLRLGRSEGLLEPLLDEIGSVDFYCHDSPVNARHFEFEMKAIRTHLKPGSLVVADNVYWRAFDEIAQSVGTSPIRRRKSSLAAFRIPTPRQQI